MSSQRPPPAASGRLEKTPLAHLIVYAHERQLTGTLELETPEKETASILFLEGQPAKVKTSAAIAHLGRVLLELGFIDQGRYDRSLVQLSQTKRLHGQILIESGALNDDQLVAGLRAQILRKLQHVYSFAPESQFRFFDGYDALASFGGDETVSVDPLPLVWAAIRSAPPWVHISNTLTRVTQLPLRLSRRAELTRFEFGRAERDLIELLRMRPMKVTELTQTEVLKPRETQLLVYCLLITRQIQVVQEGRDSMPPPPPRAPNPEQANVMSFSLHTAAPVIAETTPRPQPAPNIPPAPRAPSIATPPAIPAPSAKPPVAAPSTTVSPELGARRQEILARAETIDREDYFQMLALDRSATPEMARDAFFALAKTWHPDKLPQPLADVRDACARIFARISEAHATLADPKKRENYMRLLKDGGATPEAQATIVAVVEAATNFQKAEVCMKRNDLAQAEALCRKAHEADPQQPDYLALLAWLDALKPEKQTAEATRASIAMLDRAVSISERCERAYFYRGLLHKRTGNHAQALRDFRKSAELNPRNIDAVREVRLYEMRKERGSIAPPGPSAAPAKKDEKPGGGLFGKLFKK
jgi:curved DNA-binding protein CbpA